MASFGRRRLRVLAFAALVGLALAAGAALDARARVAEGHARHEQTAAVARVTGLSDLALSTSSTWLRHPSLAAASAGASDAPLGLDVDPAGAVIPRRGRERTLALHREAP